MNIQYTIRMSQFENSLLSDSPEEQNCQKKSKQKFSIELLVKKSLENQK